MTTVFSGETTATSSTDTTSTSAEQRFIDSLVGEGKKYKTEEELAKAYIHADGFIDNLKRENGELKEDLQKRLSAEQILEEIKKGAAPERVQGDTTNPLLTDESKLLSLVDKRIEGRKLEEIRSNNIREADQAIRNTYGEKAVEVITKKSQELGVPVKWLEDMAAQSPKALLTLLGIDNSKATQSTTTVTRGTVNSEVINNNPTGSKSGTWSYYQELRKSNPSAYFTPKIQNEIMTKRQELGDKFYS